MARGTAKDRQQSALDFGVSPPNHRISQEIDIDFDFRRDLREAMARTKVSRATIAARMTDILFSSDDGEVTRSQLDSWCAHSKESWRMPATHLAAFISVTGAQWILEKLARRCGCLVIPKEEAALVELGRVIAERERLNTHERDLIADLPPEMVDAFIRAPKARR